MSNTLETEFKRYLNLDPVHQSSDDTNQRRKNKKQDDKHFKKKFKHDTKQSKFVKIEKCNELRDFKGL